MEYFIGFLGGVTSGLFGTGGGLIIYPALSKILKMDEYKARGTTLISILPITLIASIFYSNNSYINWSKTFLVIIGGCIGGFIGAKIMNKIPRFYLAISFDIFLIILSIKNIIQG